MKKKTNLKVMIVMGSQSDYKTMKLATNILKKLGIKFDTKIISAHRTPNRMYDYAKRAEKNNVSVMKVWIVKKLVKKHGKILLIE